MRFSQPLAVAALALALSGCSPHGTSSTAPPDDIAASDISSIDTALMWARGLTLEATTDELSAGVQATGDQFSALDGIWFETHNEIGQELVQLNLDITAHSDSPGDFIDDIQAEADKIEDAIAKGDNP